MLIMNPESASVESPLNFQGETGVLSERNNSLHNIREPTYCFTNLFTYLFVTFIRRPKLTNKYILGRQEI